MVAVELEQPVRTAAALLEWSRAVVDPPLRAAVASLPDSTAHLVEYHFGWRDAAGAPAREYGGKAVRPLLTLLAARAAGAEASGPGGGEAASIEAAVPAAVAVELVHNFSLVHDDIMDGDRTRRHRATLWTVHGAGPAILAGDAMLALAYQTIASDVRAAAVLGAAVQRLIDGPLADLAFEQRGDVTPAECVAMAESKTAALLAVSAELGAAAGGGSAAAGARLSRFGRLVGLAFQFADDLLGIWGDPAVTGKPVRSDLQSGKKSLPVVAALHAGLPASARLAELYRGGGLSDPDAQRAAGLIEECGARAWCQTRADELFDEALAELTEDDRDLAILARLLTRRDR